MIIPNWNEQVIISSSTNSAEDNDAKQPRPQASVCFAPEEDNIIHETLPLAEYSAQEIHDCWYTRAEYNAQKRHALITLNLNRTSTLSPQDPEYTMRGLECRTRECADSRRIMRFRASAAVFDEQSKQFQQGIRNSEAISEAYHAISWHSMYDAHTQGMADEQDSQTCVSQPPRFASKRKSNLLSKIISIERNEAEVAFAPASMLPSSNLLFLGMDCKLQLQSNSFNLNSFFNDLSVGVVAA